MPPDAYAQGYTGKGVTVGVTDVSIVNFAILNCR